MEKNKSTPVELIQNKFSLDAEEANALVSEVRDCNGGTLIGLNKNDFLNLAKEIRLKTIRKEKEEIGRQIYEKWAERRQRKLDLTCPFCYIKLSSKQSRDRHIKIIHGDKPSTKPESNETNPDPPIEKCDICGKCFKHSTSLKRHMKQHETESKISCDICKKEFGREDTLKKHLRNTHSSFNINFEEIRMKQASRLEEDNLVCMMCKADFGKDSEKFEMHLILKECQITEKEKTDKKRNKTCPLCFRVFSSKQACDRHIRYLHTNKDNISKRSTDDSDINENCPHCRKSFKLATSLKRHMKQHENEEHWFYWDKCDAKFKRIDNLYQHQRSIHFVYNINFDEAKRTSMDNFECKMCGTNFDSNFHKFKAHISLKSCQKTEEKIVTNDQLRFQFQLCEKSYTNKNNFSRHLKLKHKMSKDS